MSEEHPELWRKWQILDRQIGSNQWCDSDDTDDVTHELQVFLFWTLYSGRLDVEWTSQIINKMTDFWKNYFNVSSMLIIHRQMFLKTCGTGHVAQNL